MISNQPLVTIVAVSFNQEKYIFDTLNSIINQTYKNIQLIIADDGSTDNTKQLITQWIAINRPDTQFLNHPLNMGVTKNLNSAIPFIKGEYYQFIGCEDNMLPYKIQMQVKLLTDNKDISVVYSDMKLMDEDGNVFSKTHYQTFTEEIPQSGNIYGELIKKCFITTPTALMKTEVLKKIEGDNEKLDINDYDFWIRASKQFLFLYHNDITMNYRVVPNSLSRRGGILYFKNAFLVYYFNYDKRKPYRNIFNERMMFYFKNLRASGYKYTALYGIKAFLKSFNIYYLYVAIKYATLLFKGKKN